MTQMEFKVLVHSDGEFIIAYKMNLAQKVKLKTDVEYWAMSTRDVDLVGGIILKAKKDLEQ